MEKKRIEKAAELYWVLGILFVALGVALCSKADLGVSMIAAPAFIVYEAIAPVWNGFSVGMTEYMIQGLMLIILCFVIGKFNWRYLLAFAVAVIYGYALDLFLFLLKGFSPASIAARWLVLIAGDCVTAVGVSCFFSTYLPLQVYELFVAELASSFSLDINKVKRVFDISCLIISVALALVLFRDAGSFDWSKIGCTCFHSLGLGTVFTTIVNSALIAFFGKQTAKILDKEAFFPRLEALLRRE